MKKINLKELFHNDIFLRILSVLIAVISWFIVVNFIDQVGTTTVRGVPIQVDTTSAQLVQLGLKPVDDTQQQTVNVTISGQRSVIGNVTSDDLSAYAQLGTVTEAGSFSLPVAVTNTSDKEFQIVSYTPERTTIRFDRQASKTLTVQAMVTGLSVADGYMALDETVTPSQVVVTGPQAEVDRVASCVVAVNLDGELSRSRVVTSQVMLLDADGNAVESDYLNLDHETVDVTITVMRVKDLPVTIGFTNIPTDFPLEELEYSFSQDTVRCAMPVDVQDRYTELNLGYIDFKSLTLDPPYEFSVHLPDGFINIDDVDTVDVAFESEGYESRYFDLTNVRVLNVPSGYAITPVSRRLAQVQVFGPAEVLETMTSNDLVIELDASTIEIMEGQHMLPVNVSAPGKGLVWAVGEHQMVFQITEIS